MLDSATGEEIGKESEKGQEKWELVLSPHSITSEISGVVGSFSYSKPQKIALTINSFHKLLIFPHCLSRRTKKTLHITAETQ